MNTATFNTGKHFWKRLGLVGFIFFLVKGVVWMAVPVVMYLLGNAS